MPVESISNDRRRKAVWWLLLSLPVAACIGMAALGPTAARAAFPGGEGRIVFTEAGDASHSNESHGPMRTIAADGTGLTFLTDYGASPEWSPDGSKIVFERGSCFCNPHVAVINQDGSGEAAITNTSDLFWEFEPTWSPDGRIAYTRVLNPAGVACRALWVIGQDGSGAHEILAPEQGPCYKKQSAWSPDGSLIAFSGAPTVGYVPTEIYTVRPDGTGLTQLTSSGGNSASQADWSPSGTEIAYHFSHRLSEFGWEFEFHIMGSDGSNDRLVRQASGYASVYIDDFVMAPAWSPDGSELAFQSPNSGPVENGLYAVRPDNTQLRPIRAAPLNLVRNHRDPDWQRIAPPPPPDPRDCNGVFDGATVHNLTVKKGRTCTLVDSTVTGRVEVNKGAYFEADHTDIARKVSANKSLSVFIHGGSTVARGIDAHRTARVLALDSFVTDGALKVSEATELVQVCGMTVAKNLKVRKSGPDIAIGNPNAGDCDGNRLGGDVEVVKNTIDVQLAVRSNTIAGDLRIQQNRGPGGKSVSSNVGGKTLDCRKNDPPFLASNNSFERRTGQCSGP